MNYPKATKNPKILTKHDHERVDNYYWLNDREDDGGHRLPSCRKCLH